MKRFKSSKDDVTGEMIKSGCELLTDWIWKLSNMTFESGVVPEDWRTGVKSHSIKVSGND